MGHQVKAETRRQKIKAELFQLFPSFRAIQWINSEAVELTWNVDAEALLTSNFLHTTTSISCSPLTTLLP